MALIELEEKTAAALRVQAELRDLSLETFLDRIAAAATPVYAARPLSVAEMDRSMDELIAESPVLPPTFTRADIYSDHD